MHVSCRCMRWTAVIHASLSCRTICLNTMAPGLLRTARTVRESTFSLFYLCKGYMLRSKFLMRQKLQFIILLLHFPSDLYLKLEDVTRRFVKPCIMDVKLGQQSYDPFASQEKREQQIRKYPLMEEMGFLVLGMRVSESSCTLRENLWAESRESGIIGFQSDILFSWSSIVALSKEQQSRELE